VTNRVRTRWHRLQFGVRILLPTVLAVGLFAVAIFALILPAYERQILDRKREMIAELTHSAVSVLSEYEREERAGTITRETAQREAVTRLRFMRYGEEGKDYFWITDLEPRMIMHPYRADLEGSDLTDFADPNGKRLFVEMAGVARDAGGGYVSYAWQWKDDPDRIVPKLSHVRAFAPWGWVVGTGIYLEDVRHEITRLTAHLVRVSLGITAILTLLLLVILLQSLSIERERGRAEGALHESRERYRVLVEASTEGIALALDGRIVFANPTLREMAGRPDESLEGLAPADLFARPDGSPLADGDLTPVPAPLSLLRPDGRAAETMVTASGIRLGTRDGLILAVREVNPPERAQREREELAVELQVALQSLQEPVRNLMREPLSCGMNDPIRQAADRMRRAGMSAILVRSESGEAVGIITDRDIRDRVVAGGIAPDLQAHRIMSAPLLSFPESGLAGEALLQMFDRGVRHLAMRDSSGQVVGLLRDRELTASHRFSPASLTRGIRAAASVEEIVELRGRVPRLVAALVDSGSPPRSISRILTSVSDATHETLIARSLAELGPPPAPFVFFTLGSDGREEQTLATDQDNAILYEDVSGPERDAAAAYFLALGERVCARLDQAGYAFCPGGIMAKNPRWNLPFSEWCGLYRGWMESPEPQDLLEFSVFFDFRAVGGEAGLLRRLRTGIAETLGSHPPFLLHMARHATEFRLPIGSFGRIVTESSGDHQKTFNLKEAMAPIVHVARLYALRHGVEVTNTFERLQRLHEARVLESPGYEEIEQVYGFLMRLRLLHQARAMREGRPPDNHLPTEELTDLDRAMLKQAFARISLLIKRVGYDFLGSA
jgi:PAS domain S-box-containing protein